MTQTNRKLRPVKNKWKPLILLVLLLIAFLVKKFSGNGNDEVALDIGSFKNIEYSAHAKCRMDCRKIDKTEIKEILEKGKINNSKTRKSSKGISYAIEGWSHDNQHVRVVCSPKGAALVIVTVIDLDTNWSCDCS